MGTPFPPLAVAATAWLAAADACASDATPPVALELVPASAPDRAWPRPCGAAVPDGLLRRGERLAVFERGGAERPARVTAWAAAANGSPCLARIEIGELPRDVRRLELRSTAAPAPEPALRCEHAPQRLRFHGSADAGAFEWREEARGAVLAVVSGDAALEFTLGSTGLADDGEERRPERRGPTRVVGPDGGGAEFAVALHFGEEAAEAATLALRLTLAPSAQVAELELAFEAPRDLVLRQLSLRGRVVGGGAELLRGTTAVPIEVGGVRSSIEAGQLGALLPEERVAAARPLSLRAGAGRARVELRWPDFGRARPSGARLQADGSFQLDLVAQPLRMHAGQTLRRTLSLARGDRVGSACERPFLLARGDEPALDEATRAWLEPWRGSLASWLAQPCRVDDRGCYREEFGELANGEYDLGGSLLWLGAVERDARWLECGALLVRHTLDWDRGVPPLEGPAAEPVPRGLFFQHGDDHASGKFEAGHQWIGGALRLACAEGSLVALDAARGCGRALAQWRPQSARFAGPERRLAWPLRVAAELHEQVDDPGARALGEALLRDVAARRTTEGFLDGDRRPSRDGPRVWINSWVSLGITVEALVRAERQFPGSGAEKLALELARFVLEEARVQEGMAEVLLVDPESRAVVETHGRCRAGNAAFAAAGLRWYGQARGELGAGKLAATLAELARRDLATPDGERAVELAKALLALRFERDGARSPAAQSLSSPSNLPTARPREKR